MRCKASKTAFGAKGGGIEKNGCAACRPVPIGVSYLEGCSVFGYFLLNSLARTPNLISILNQVIRGRSNQGPFSSCMGWM